VSPGVVVAEVGGQRGDVHPVVQQDRREVVPQPLGVLPSGLVERLGEATPAGRPRSGDQERDNEPPRETDAGSVL
jgi:hypothetical protein